MGCRSLLIRTNNIEFFLETDAVRRSLRGAAADEPSVVFELRRSDGDQRDGRRFACTELEARPEAWLNATQRQIRRRESFVGSVRASIACKIRNISSDGGDTSGDLFDVGTRIELFRQRAAGRSSSLQVYSPAVSQHAFPLSAMFDTGITQIRMFLSERA